MQVHVETELEARPEDVWAVLTDLSRFSAWNPFIREASGTIEVGARVRVAPRTSLGLRLSFHPTVTVCAPPRELRWRGRFGSDLLARGEHTFAIAPSGEGRVRLIQHMEFRGLLPRVLGRLIAREATRGFAAMNQALAARVTSSARSMQAARA
jgi:hypothetical protein